MADKRMFTKKILRSDAFMDMPLSTQMLYVQLNMDADDEGFVGNPNTIKRMIGASDDDFRILKAKRFLLEFENGVIVVKHWQMHNSIRKDRLKPTQYTTERLMITTKENDAYTEVDNQMSTKCQPNVGIDKIRLDKNSIDKNSNKDVVDVEFKDLTIKDHVDNYLEDKSEDFKIAFNEFVAMNKSIKNAIKTEYQLKLLTNKLDKLSSNEDEQIEIINNAVMNSWKGFYPLDKNKTNAFKPKKSVTDYKQREYSESIESMFFGAKDD